MFKNYIKIAWRNITRHKDYAFINVAGLTVGVAACLLIFVVVNYELSFNTYHKNYKNIYHIVTQQKHAEGVSYSAGVPIPTTDALRLDFPQAKVASFNTAYGSQFAVGGNDNTDKKFTEPTGVMFMEPEYFQIFDAKWLAGSAAALKQPDMLVIDKTTATKYFGSWTKAMGQPVKMDNLINLKVGGVIEDAPSNTDMPIKVMISFVTWKKYGKQYSYVYDWHNNSSNHQVYMLLPERENVERISNSLKTFDDRHANDKEFVKNMAMLQPLSQVHFDSRFGTTTGDHIMPRATINTLSFIAVLIIIMASINFINLSTAQSVGRSKEVGIRKVLGSSRGQLIGQVIGETGIIVVMAVAIAVLIAKLALPFLKNIANVPNDIGLISINSILFLVLVTVLVVLLSGIYPALIVSGFKPVLALKNKITAASVGGIPMRRVLVVTQFAISQLLIIGTIIAVKQMNYVNAADLGFNKDAVLIIPGYTDSVSLRKMDAFKQKLLQTPDVKAVSYVSDSPSSDNSWGSNFYYNNSATDNGITTFLKFGDADYFKTFGLRFVAGKGYDLSDTSRQAVVNEAFLAKVGVKRPEEAIGKTVRIGGGKHAIWLPITGVVKNFRTNSLREEVHPIVIQSVKTNEWQTAVKLQTSNLSATVANVQRQWEATFPAYAYNGYFLDGRIAEFYTQERQMTLVYQLFACIAIFISCLGLYGLVSFMVVQRTKEVGVRKVLGASVGNIVVLFSKEFMVLIGVSFVIAMPLGWYMMSGWLQNFNYRISISADVFVLAVILSAVLAWLTVGYKSVRAALVTPVKSLRSE